MAAARLTEKVNKIIKECEGDDELLDRRIDSEITIQEVLTIGLMPINSQLRNMILGCFTRVKNKKKDIKKLQQTVKNDDLVPVEIQGGGKCKITVFMTREAAERERGR